MTPIHPRLARFALATAIAGAGLIAAAAPGHAASCAPDPQGALSPCEQAAADRPGATAAAANSPHEALLATLAEVTDTYLSEGLLKQLTSGQTVTQ